jgi:hypothetical protein
MPQEGALNRVKVLKLEEQVPQARFIEARAGSLCYGGEVVE